MCFNFHKRCCVYTAFFLLLPPTALGFQSLHVAIRSSHSSGRLQDATEVTLVSTTIHLCDREGEENRTVPIGQAHNVADNTRAIAVLEYVSDRERRAKELWSPGHVPTCLPGLFFAAQATVTLTR